MYLRFIGLVSIIVNILFFTMENTFSAQSSKKIFKKKFDDDSSDDEAKPLKPVQQIPQSVERPTWNNQAIKSQLITLWGNFYVNNHKPPFLEQLKFKKSVGKTVYEGFLDKFINQLNITIDINKVEEIYKKYEVIALRVPTKDKLVLSCGNFQTDVPQGHFCPKYQDAHPDADTVDIDLAMNPTVVADLSKSGFYDYLISLNKLYKNIIAEGGYTLHGSSGLEKLRKILAVKGVYRLHAGTSIEVVNKGKPAVHNLQYSDQQPVLELSADEYNRLSQMEPKLTTQFLTKKLEEYYAKEGFSLHITHPEHFLLRKILERGDNIAGDQYTIGRHEGEAAGISLIRER